MRPDVAGASGVNGRLDNLDLAPERLVSLDEDLGQDEYDADLCLLSAWHASRSPSPLVSLGNHNLSGSHARNRLLIARSGVEGAINGEIFTAWVEATPGSAVEAR